MNMAIVSCQASMLVLGNFGCTRTEVVGRQSMGDISLPENHQSSIQVFLLV